MKRAAQQSVTTNRLRAGVRNSLIIGVGRKRLKGTESQLACELTFM